MVIEISEAWEAHPGYFSLEFDDFSTPAGIE